MYTIAVVGGGVIGLTTAVAIQKKMRSSVTVTIFTEDISPNTTGDVSAGLWTPFLLQETPIDKVIKWSKVTFDYGIKLWKEGKVEENGISIHPAINFTTNEPYQPPIWSNIALGYHEFTQEELKKIRKEYKKDFTGGYCFVTWTWEPSIFLPKLQEEFLKNGGSIRIEKIHNLKQLSKFDVIVNCCGLNAKNLTGDNSVVPVRGQVTRVKAPMQFYTFMNDGDECCYIIPNINHVVMGGTHQDNDYNLNVDESDRKQILSGCYEKIPALKGQPIIKHMVGLRPGRKQVRLESEVIKDSGKTLKIVHNYGHGGSGVTVSIGCAEDAAVLVETLLNKSKL